MNHSLYIAFLAAIVALLGSAQGQVLMKTGNRFQGTFNNMQKFQSGSFRSLKSTKNDPAASSVSQKLDHFDPLSTQTWQQKIYINDSYFAPASGRVFMILGGEGPMSSGTVTDHFVVSQYAKRYNALIVGAEHRFYGSSVPTKDLSVEGGLRYLSTEQAMEDFATVRNYIVDKYRIDQKNAKVVAFGGSYSGNLAAFMRIKYPHLFVGALASSAPVLAQLDFHQYMDVVANSVGKSCVKKMRAATDQFERMAQTETGRQKLGNLFSTCYPISSDSDDLSTFFSSISDAVCGVVQYNNDNVGYSGAFNMTKMCDIVESAADPAEGYATFVHQYNQFLGENCVTSRYSDYLDELKNEKTFDQGNAAAAGRSWIFQTCTEFGYYQSAEGRSQPFSSKYLTLDWFVNQCKDIYGIDVDTIAPATRAINQRYGGDNPKNLDKIMFTNGDVDPWHYLRVKSPQAHTSLMHGTAHCADLYPPRSNDVQDLKSTRAVFESKLQEWIQ